MILDSNGRLGINVASPAAPLHITAGTPSGGTFSTTQCDSLIDSTGQTGLQIIGGTHSNIFLGPFATGYQIIQHVSSGSFFINGPSGSAAIMIEGGTQDVGMGTNVPTTALQVIGTITGSAKNFLIDDPRDPYNSFLRHGCVESDEYKNVYDGVITTDARGFATVTLPDWFDAINEKFRYQLTVLDDGEEFVHYKVTREIQNNQFTIRTSQPKIKVSWQVTGVRKDAYVKANPLIVEEAKGKDWKGKLLNEESAPAKTKPAKR